MEQVPGGRQKAESGRSASSPGGGSGTGAGGEVAPDGRPSRNVRQGGGAGATAGAGLQFAVSILLFLYIGQWLDDRFGWAPWGTLLGVFIGAAAGFTSIYRSLMSNLRREEEAKRRE